jgi:Putative zinc-finger
MNCADVEILICDYVDGTLAPAERMEVESHLAECRNCAELARDGATAVEFMERAEVVEPPQELISHILFDPPWHRQRAGWFSQVLHPLLQPRFAMGMALTVLSFAMIMPKMRQFQPTDLSPAVVWAGIEGRVDRLWERTEKFYDNLKFIYQIRATLREWQQQSADTKGQSGLGTSTEQHRVPVPNAEEHTGKP